MFVVRCPDYDHVGERMSELLSLMGGMDRFAASGEKIVLKVNLLQPTGEAGKSRNDTSCSSGCGGAIGEERGRSPQYC